MSGVRPVRAASNSIPRSYPNRPRLAPLLQVRDELPSFGDEAPHVLTVQHRQRGETKLTAQPAGARQITIRDGAAQRDRYGERRRPSVATAFSTSRRGRPPSR